MTYFLLALILLLTIALALSVHLVLRYRKRLHRALLHFPHYPIRKITLDQFQQIFQCDEFGPTLATEVAFIGCGPLVVPGGTTDAEAWILSVLAKHAKLMIEFGTCTGKTAYLWARNSPPDARVITITLGGSQHDDYTHGATDSLGARIVALEESRFQKFLYSETIYEQKITQLFLDSKQFDENPYHGKADLIFIDGSHAFSYVQSDTEKAFRMIASGGIILWHDYREHDPNSRDVYRFLNEISCSRKLVYLGGTSMVAHLREK